MKKYYLIIFVGVFISFNSLAQRNIIDSNVTLLKKQEEKYKAHCINYKTPKFSKTKLKIDKILVHNLNLIFRSSLENHQLFSLLKKKGYKQTRIRRKDILYDEVTYTKVNEGELNAYFNFKVDRIGDTIISKKIILATKRHFLCETEQLWSSSWIDFEYLKLIIRKIEIPLHVSYSLDELESKYW